MSLSNVTELDAFVRDEFMPKIESQIVMNNAVIARLEGKGKYVADSGEHIRTAARYERLPGGSYARGTKFSTTQKETVKEYIHPWTMYYVDVTIDGWTEAVAMGSNKIRNIVEDKMDNARETMSHNLNLGLLSGGEGNEIDGLLAVCDDGTNYATYGNITRATDTWAQAQYNGTGGAYTNSMFQTEYGNCSKNNKHPDMIITTQSIYNSIWNKMTPQQRYNQSDAHADIRALGFAGIEFNQAIVIVDDNCPSGVALFLNTDFLEFVVHRDRNMSWQNFMTHIDEDAKTGRFYWMGNLVCPAPRYQGQINTIT
jgi:hypothetical protein